MTVKVLDRDGQAMAVCSNTIAARYLDRGEAVVVSPRIIQMSDDRDIMGDSLMTLEVEDFPRYEPVVY